MLFEVLHKIIECGFALIFCVVSIAFELIGRDQCTSHIARSEPEISGVHVSIHCRLDVLVNNVEVRDNVHLRLHFHDRVKGLLHPRDVFRV